MVHQRVWRNLASGLLLAISLLAPSTAFAVPPTAEQRTQLKVVEAALKKAANLYSAKKYAESGEALAAAQASLNQLMTEDSPELTALTGPLLKRAARARDLLEAEGVKLPATKAKAPDGKRKPTGTAPAKDEVSFRTQVAPLLVAKCGSCHIQRSRGEFNMATYVALSRGSQSGSVIMPGDAKGSRIVELIEAGDMPRGNGEKVTADELKLLVSWINAGAKFDGPDSAAPLASFSAAKKAEAAPEMLGVIVATGKEDVQYARDVAPIFREHCFECHGEQNPRNNFSVDTFERLLRGGDSGLVLMPGKPAESLLIKKLKGESGQRMPLDAKPLTGEVIAKIERWIALGAKFDGTDPKSSLDELIAQGVASRATHDELRTQRAQRAAKDWRLILPDAQPTIEETQSVLVYGNLSPAIISDVARMADEQVVKLRKVFKVAEDQPFIKGRLTLFVFDKRYDYGEVGTMLEHREIPSTWRGHWVYTPADAYGCVLVSSSGEASPAVVAQQLAGAYVASLGKIPHWFSEGTARMLSARIDPKDPRVKLWDDSVPRILSTHERADGFITGTLPPEESDILSYSYVKQLFAQPNRYAALIGSLQEGQGFAQAFEKAYGATPSQMVGTWVAKASRQRSGAARRPAG